MHQLYFVRNVIVSHYNDNSVIFKPFKNDLISYQQYISFIEDDFYVL